MPSVRSPKILLNPVIALAEQVCERLTTSLNDLLTSQTNSTRQCQQTLSIINDIELNGSGIRFEVGSVDTSGHSGWFNDFTAKSSYTELVKTENPRIDVNGDGIPEAEYNGTLEDGETVTSQVNIEHGTYTVDVETANSSWVDWQYSGYNEGRTYVQDLRIGDTVTTIDEYLANGETISQTVSVTPGKQTFGVVTGEHTVHTNISELVVSGGYSAFEEFYVDPDNPITHKIHSEKDIVWSYSRSVTEARPVGDNITMWTNGNYANVTLHSLAPRSNDTVSQFTVEMDNGTFHLQLHGLYPNSDYILYEDDIATTTLTTDDSGTLSWNKSSDWSTHSVRIEKLLDGSDSTPEDEPDDGIVPSTECERRTLPGVGCVPQPAWFWGSRIGSGVGTLLVGVRTYQEYSGA